MHVAQVLQRGFFLIGHTLGKIRIGKALIARGLWHVLQDAKLLFDHLLAIPRHLPHLRQYIILNVVALLRCEASPRSLLLLKVCPLRRGHMIPLIELLANLGLLVGRQILERLAILQHAFALLRGH